MGSSWKLLRKVTLSPFITVPQKAFFANNRSALKHADFASEAIQELVQSGCVIEVRTRPQVVNPLSVSIQNSGKIRLILDLRYVNKHIWKEKFKFEDIRVACNYLPTDHLCSNSISNLAIITLILRKITNLPRFLLAIQWGYQVSCLYCSPVWVIVSPIHFH